MPIYKVENVYEDDSYELGSRAWEGGEVYIRRENDPENIVDVLWQAKFLADGNVSVYAHPGGRIQIRRVTGNPDVLLLLTPQVRTTGDCGMCFPPGILQRMNADENGENGEVQTCDECRIYTSDAGARAALRRFIRSIFWATTHARPYVAKGAYTNISAYYTRGKIGILVKVRLHDGGIFEDRFEWPLAQWGEHPTFGFDPATAAPLADPTREEVVRIMVALDQYLEQKA